MLHKLLKAGRRAFHTGCAWLPVGVVLYYTARVEDSGYRDISFLPTTVLLAPLSVAPVFWGMRLQGATDWQCLRSLGVVLCVGFLAGLVAMLLWRSMDGSSCIFAVMIAVGIGATIGGTGGLIEGQKTGQL